MVFQQQVAGMPEADLVEAHHPVDHRAADSADTETMPEVLVRRDHQRRRTVVVERAAANQVIAAVFLQLDTGRLDQAHDRDLTFQASNLFFGDSG